MGKPSAPQYPTITPAQVPTGSDLYSQGLSFVNGNGLGYTLNAQGNALQNATNPAYYNSFQPTSFAQALGNQSFQNIWPNEQAAIQQQQSLTGNAYSPGAAAATGQAYGNLATGIGEYLNQQGMQEANNGINAGLGINPNEILSPYVTTAGNQANTQAQLDQQTNLTNASGSYANQLSNYNQQMALSGALGQLGGAAIGAVMPGYGGAAGASLGAGIGGSLFGSQNSIAPYLQASQAFNTAGQNQSPFNGLFSGGGGGTGYTTSNYGSGLGYGSTGGGIGQATSPTMSNTFSLS